MTKAEALRRHSRRRAWERYGLEVGPNSRRAIIDAIQDGRAHLVRRTSLRASVWDVDLDGLVVRVVYDRTRHELVTFLPRDA